MSTSIVETWASSRAHSCLNQLTQTKMKALIILAKAIQIVMGSSVGIAIAFALYKVATNQV